MNNSEFEKLLKNALKDEKNPPDILNQKLKERINNHKKTKFWQNYNVKVIARTAVAAAAVIVVCIGAFNSKSHVIDYLNDITDPNGNSEIAMNEHSSKEKSDDEERTEDNTQTVNQEQSKESDVKKEKETKVTSKTNNTSSSKKSESEKNEQIEDKNKKSKTDRFISDLLPTKQEDILEVATAQSETAAFGGMLARGVAERIENADSCVLIFDESLTQEENEILNKYVNAYISNRPTAVAECEQKEETTGEYNTTESENNKQYNVLNNSERYYSVEVKLPTGGEESTTKTFTLDKENGYVVGLSELFSEYEDYRNEISDRVNQKLDEKENNGDKDLYISAGDEDFYINENEEVVITLENEDNKNTEENRLNIGKL